MPSKRVILGSSRDDYYSDVAVMQRLFSGGKHFAQLSAAKSSTDAEMHRLRPAPPRSILR